MPDLLVHLPTLSGISLAVVLVLVLFQEAINGFHDTANAIAAVIYSRAMAPGAAVAMSAVLNFFGVLLGGTAVAFSLVYLLPVHMVAGIDTIAEASFLLALVLTAVAWNFTTWYLGIPNSTTHTYVGAILGASAAHAFIHDGSLARDMNWHEGEMVIAALVLSPILGFVLAMVVYRVVRRLVRDERMYRPGDEGDPPPGYIRGLLIAGAGGISFLHGSNDGQKSIGIMFLVLIGLAPAVFAIDRDAGPEAFSAIERSVGQVGAIGAALSGEAAVGEVARDAAARAADAQQIFAKYQSLTDIPEADVLRVRTDLLELQRELSVLLKSGGSAGMLDAEQTAQLERARADIRLVMENVPYWLIAVSATCLGIGTAIGYRRIVTTLGERMSSAHMNAAHGTATQLTAMACIAFADGTGAPVSTTHIVTSGVAGSMHASGAGLQGPMVRNIVITWVTTLPGSLLLSFALSTVLYHALV